MGCEVDCRSIRGVDVFDAEPDSVLATAVFDRAPLAVSVMLVLILPAVPVAGFTYNDR